MPLQLSRTTNWTFEASWCPRLPDLVAVGSFDGKVDVHSLQATRSPEETQAEAPSGADLFEQGNLNVQSFPAVSLSQAPKWTKRPAAAAFGFGGKLVSINAKNGAQVKISHVVTEPDVVERAVKLDVVSDSQALADFAIDRASGTGVPSTSTAEVQHENDTWNMLKTLFNTDSREELVTLLGFSKDDIKFKVEDAIKRFKTNAPAQSPRMPTSTSGLSNSSQAGDDEAGSTAREPLVTFAEEPEEAQEGVAPEGAKKDAQPTSESGASTNAPESAKTMGEGTEITEPSLFGDDAPAQQQATADFYSSIHAGRPSALPEHLFASGEREHSSVAATMGSRASSVTSMDQMRHNTFKIYPAEEGEADRLLTRALIMGDFESAVNLCLSTDRFADALLLAVRGGPELLASTQKVYFERHTANTPYLRLFQSIVSNDLGDIVQNADLSEWQEIFVVLCTFARKDEFSSFVESLGQRIEFAAAQTKPADPAEALKLRKNALLTYLAAQRLEKVVGIFSEEMKEEEASDAAPKASAHAKALQSFIEKVAVFKAATGYVDSDLKDPTSSQTVAASGARTYKLAGLYDRYLEYAELLASQGLSTLALGYVNQVPADYQSAEHDDTEHVRERLLAAAGKAQRPVKAPAATAAAAARPAGQPARAPVMPSLQPPAAPGYKPSTSPALTNPFNAFGSAPQPQQAPAAPAAPPSSSMPAPPANPYGPPRTTTPGSMANVYGSAPPAASAANPYAPNPQVSNPYMPAGGMNPPPGPAAGTAPPPPPMSSSMRKPDQGWNDAPTGPPPAKRTPSTAPPARSQLTSPFPGAPQSSMPPPPPSMGGVPPPPQPYGAPALSHSQGPPPPPPASMTMPPPPPRAGSMSPATSMHQPNGPPMPSVPPPQPMTATPFGSAPPPGSGPYAPAAPPVGMGGIPPPPQPPMAASSPYMPAVQTMQPPPPGAGGMGMPQRPTSIPPKPATPVKPEPPKPKYRE